MSKRRKITSLFRYHKYFDIRFVILSYIYICTCCVTFLAVYFKLFRNCDSINTVNEVDISQLNVNSTNKCAGGLAEKSPLKPKLTPTAK